jgi:hypothetical protein
MRIPIQLITLMRIPIELITLMRIPIQLITLMRIRILPFNLMQIHADSDPQHLDALMDTGYTTSATVDSRRLGN